MLLIFAGRPAIVCGMKRDFPHETAIVVAGRAAAQAHAVRKMPTRAVATFL